MKFAETLRGLVRRWYIVVPGLLLTASLALGAWFMIPPGYERSATQLLLPGANSMPEGANPYLFLGGLSPAADVLVRAIGSKNVLNEVLEAHPGVDMQLSRDTTTAGPVILITVTADSDSAANEVLTLLVARTATVLNELQASERIPPPNRVSVIPITVDSQSTLQQRPRLLATAGAAIVGVMFTLLLAGLVEGLSRRRERRGAAEHVSEENTRQNARRETSPEEGQPARNFPSDRSRESEFVQSEGSEGDPPVRHVKENEPIAELT